MLITYDIGHGLNTSGKRPPNGGLNGAEREWKFNKLYADAFVAQMKKYNGVTIKCVSDTTGKVDTPLATRTSKVNSLGSNLHISFHCNASLGKWGDWTGTEVHVYKNVASTSASYKLAAKVAPVLAKAMGLNNRGIKKTNLHMNREVKCTSILLENGFMDSTKDIKKLRDTATMKKAGTEIAKAVAAYYGLKLKPTTTTTTKPTTTTTSKPAASTGTTHTVKSGDTLYAISKKYGVTVAQIQKWNNMGTSTTLTVGKKLIVSAVTYHTVVSGDTLWGISKKYGVTVAQIKEWNNLKSDTLSIGQKLIVKK